MTPLTLMQSVRTVAGYRIEKLAEERPDWFGRDLAALLERLRGGRIDPVVEPTYPLEEAARAHGHLASAKLVLTTGQ